MLMAARYRKDAHKESLVFWDFVQNKKPRSFATRALKLRTCAFEEYPAAEIVVPRDQERRDCLHGLISDAQEGHAYEHIKIVQAQAHDRQDREDRELTLAAHTLAMIENILHAQYVVDHNRRNE